MGLPESRRLKDSADFARVRAEGTAYPGKFLLLGVLPVQADSSPWRCGFITTKKIGNAVWRNRIRRRLREIARAAPIRDGFCIVTIARWRAPQASFTELRDDWLRVARRARILLDRNKPEPEVASS